jgi:hypothetical protein
MSEESTKTKLKMLRPTRVINRYSYNPIDANHKSFFFDRIQSIAPAEPRKFVPYWNPTDYLKDLKASGTNVTELEKLYKDNPPQSDVPNCKKETKNLNLEPVYKLYKKYSKPARKPPLDERIKALHEAGYSEEDLLNVMKKDAKRVAEQPELEKFIFDIFGDIGDKKTAATKKKTIVQILKIKKQSFVMPDPDDEELPNEDDVTFEED